MSRLKHLIVSEHPDDAYERGKVDGEALGIAKGKRLERQALKRWSGSDETIKRYLAENSPFQARSKEEEEEVRHVMESRHCDVIGGFPHVEPNCKGCGKPLTVKNAWMTDGCPCNSVLGINSMNETRWRLLMQLQQQQVSELQATRDDKRSLRNQLEQLRKTIEHYELRVKVFMGFKGK